MHLHFEQNISSRTECTIHSLSWMGKVPDSLPGDMAGGWKLNRGQYYSEGWLASGNAKDIVGVTFTASHCRRYDPPNRSNFNLRGHRSEVVLVRWNEPYQKLATCDAQGIIFVWIKHEGRWSIELINDRNSQVTDFAWSHDGRMALICYCDGFVLVGSVAGQRYWSSMLNLDNISITCGVWSPDDQKVMFGTTDGQIIVMSSTGAMVTQISIHEGMEITSILWSCEKFNMEETEGDQSTGVKVTAESGPSSPVEEKVHTLAVGFKHGVVYLMSNYDDICPKVINCSLTGLKIDWSNCGRYLAVGGFTRQPNLQCQNKIHFYSPAGDLTHSVSVPSQGKPLTALCWGHNDRRLFVAAGHCLHVAWVIKHVPSLQYLCQRSLQDLLKCDADVERLPLPNKLCANVQALFSPTIKSFIPDPFKLRPFVSTPPPGAERLFCTMIRHGEETSGGHYTLYLEYLGGLIPLLKGKRASKLRPDFVIYDPKIKPTGLRKDNGETNGSQYELDLLSTSTSSDSDVEADGCGGSPRANRRKRMKTFRAEKVERSTTFRTLNELFYNDNLPESSKLVEVQSNIWGTKFRIISSAAHMPEDLGNVMYKTSLLHLQPRQMTVTVSELPRDESLLAQDRNFTPAGIGEDDPDRLSPVEGLLSGVHNEHFNKVKAPRSLDERLLHDSEVISVDVLTNQCELSNQDNNSEISSMNCYSTERQKAVCMKTKLSPASETHPQNNHAFNIGEESVILDSYIHEGARPKVPLQSPYSNNQSVSEVESGILGLTRSSNLTNGIKSYSNITSNPGAKSITSPCESSSSHSIEHISNNNSGVGDYFFATKGGDQSPLDPNYEAAQDTSPLQEVNSSNIVDMLTRSEIKDNIPRWADPAIQGLKFADADNLSSKEAGFESNIIRDSSQAVTPTSDTQKRLYLEGGQFEPKDAELVSDDNVSRDTRRSHDSKMGSRLESVDSLLKVDGTSLMNSMESLSEFNGVPYSETELSLHSSLDKEIDILTQNMSTGKRKSSLLSDFERLDITHSASLPASPVHRITKPDPALKKLREEMIKGKCKHHSPIFKRKSKFMRSLETSDDDFGSSVEDIRLSINYKNLETFQKAQLKQKLRRVRCRGEDKKKIRQFVMHNKAPLWNENSQVYQLDFGGRVTQESAKNFQIEFRGKQVMQFGRIDSNAYTLDFQYPFTAIQAFAVALANVTQRLK